MNRPKLLMPCPAPFLAVSLALLALAAAAPTAFGQRPYIGYAYPAGGQQGTTFQVKLGGQGLELVNRAFTTGPGVTVKVLEYHRSLNPQEITLLNEQLRELKRAKPEPGSTAMVSETQMMADTSAMMMSDAASTGHSAPASPQTLVARIEKRVSQTVNRPASVALANIVYLEVTISPDAPPGPRELRLGTARGISNPLVFHVGQLPEFSRKPMVTAPYQVLGKEEQALRKRPADEAENRVTLPCTLNGQVASGEINRYRFEARQGQRLVISVLARQLIPYIADAVPGWFQPVLALYDSQGQEVAYADDYRFRPDPVILFEVPKEGEYVLAIYDAIFRGREDFVYRITLGELPFVTSIFPIGARVGSDPGITMTGWNLENATLPSPLTDSSSPGLHTLVAKRDHLLSNPVPFALDTFPEMLDAEPNNTEAKAQSASPPVVVNGRIDQPDDWDLFSFTGKSNELIVAEVFARRLDSPLDSMLKLTDARGNLLAFSDDLEDATAGANTHHADSWLMARLPADGKYFVHVGDNARNGGKEYGYRLRLSPPQPDFDLRVVPSSLALRSKSTGTLDVHAVRRDGFAGPIKLTLKDPPAGFSANPVTLSSTQTVARFTIRTTLPSTDDPVNLTVIGTAKIDGQDLVREAVPAEDRMQAFLWRHLVPASELAVLVYDPNFQPPPKRVPPPRPVLAAAAADPQPSASSTNAAAKPKFSKQQVTGRLRQLKFLYEEGLLTDTFYSDKVAECEAAQ